MAEKAKFVGSIQHTEDTLQRLFKTEYRTYKQLRILIRMVIGFALAALALTTEMSTVLQGILLLVGCWLLVSRDFPAAVQADKAVDGRKGNLPQNMCTFFKGSLQLSGEGTMRLEYSRFQRLIEDNEYLYLFLGPKSVCMIDKATVEGGSAEDLKEFVAQRTGLSWRRNRSLLSMNLTDLRQALQDHRKR